MSQLVRRGALLAVAVGLVLTACVVPASAQVAVTSYYAPVAPQPVVSYVPVRRGLFFPRIVYRPVVTYPMVAAPAAVTSYYAPAAPVIAAPVTTYYAPAPVTTYYAPAPVTTYYAPTPVTTYYAPAVPARSCCGH